MLKSNKELYLYLPFGLSQPIDVFGYYCRRNNRLEQTNGIVRNQNYVRSTKYNGRKLVGIVLGGLTLER